MDRDLRIRVIMNMVSGALAPLRAIGKQSTLTSAALRNTQGELKHLKKVQADIASFRTLHGQLKGTGDELTVAQARVSDLAKEFNAAGSPTKKLTADFKNAKTYAKKLTEQHAEQEQKLHLLRDSLKNARVPTADLAAQERKLRRDITDATAAMDKQKAALAALGKRQKLNNEATRALNQTRQRASTMAVGGAATLGTGLAILAPLQAAIGVASQYQATMTSIAQKTGLSRIETGKLGMALASLGPRVNQLPADLAAGADVLAGFGLTAKAIPQLMLPIGRAATAYEAQIEDLSKASFAVVDNLKVPFNQTGRAIDIMAEAGKRGAFELKDMAQYFPALTASAQGLGQTGAPAVADLAAALQITRKGAGDASTAANNLQNLLAKISSPGTTKAFAKMGVDLPAALKKMYAEGKTPIEAISELTNKTLKGDLSQLGKLFEDMQVQQALRPLIGNLALYRQIRSDALKASGTVEADYAERLLDAGQGSKALEVATQSLQVKLGTVLIPTMVKLAGIATDILDRLTEWTDAHPELTRWLAIAAATVGGLAIATGVLQIAAAGILGPLGLLRYIVAATGIASFVASGGIGAAAAAMWAALPAIAAWTLALLTNPLFWIPAAIVGLIILMSKWRAFRELPGIEMVFGKMAPEAPAQLKPVLPPTLAAQNEQTRANYDAIIKGLAAGKAGPPLKPSDPSSRLDKSAPGTSVTNQNNIKIVQQPGQSPQDLAKAVTAELDKRDRTAAARQRSSLGDYGE